MPVSWKDMRGSSQSGAGLDNSWSAGPSTGFSYGARRDHPEHQVWMLSRAEVLVYCQNGIQCVLSNRAVRGRFRKPMKPLEVVVGGSARSFSSSLVARPLVSEHRVYNVLSGICRGGWSIWPA